MQVWHTHRIAVSLLVVGLFLGISWPLTQMVSAQTTQNPMAAHEIVILMDKSNSIRNLSGGLETFKDAAKKFLRNILKASSTEKRVAIVAYDWEDVGVKVYKELTTLTDSSLPKLVAAIDAIPPPGSWTGTARAIDAVCDITQSEPGLGFMLHLTDGCANRPVGQEEGKRAAEEAYDHFKVNCSLAGIVLAEVNRDPEAEEHLRRMASPGLFSSVQIDENSVDPGDDIARAMTQVAYGVGETDVRIAILDSDSEPDYFTGGLTNSVEAALQVARSRGLEAQPITPSEIAAGALYSYDTLVLPDNAPPTDVVSNIMAWWIGGGHLVTIDSGVTFLLYAGMLFPELADQYASLSQGIYWSYESSDAITVQASRPVTAGHTPGEQIAAVASDALLRIDKLPSEAQVLAVDAGNADWATVVFYQGAGSLTFIGPSDDSFTLAPIIGNAMALDVSSILALDASRTAGSGVTIQGEPIPFGVEAADASFPVFSMESQAVGYHPQGLPQTAGFMPTTSREPIWERMGAWMSLPPAAEEVFGSLGARRSSVGPVGANLGLESEGHLQNAVNSSLFPPLTGESDDTNPGSGTAQAMMQVAYGVGETDVRIAILDWDSEPDYFTGGLTNSVEAALQVARSRGLEAQPITPSEIAAGALYSYDTLVLPDNAPPADVVSNIMAWWIGGGHIVAIDSGVTFLLYAGILFPELTDQYASSSQGIYWSYESSDAITVQKSHPVTAGHTPGEQIAAVASDALLRIDKLPSGAQVLAVDAGNADWATVVFYQGAGSLTFIGPSDDSFTLAPIIGNAMVLNVGAGVMPEYEYPADSTNGYCCEPEGTVHLHSGEYVLSSADMMVSSLGFPFEFQRTYRSQASFYGPLGHNWDINYNRYLQRTDSETLLLHDGYGRTLPYVHQGDGFYVVAQYGHYSQLTENSDGTFTLSYEGGIEDHFRSLSASSAPGYLDYICDKHSNTLRLIYDDGQLVRVQDTLGRAFHFSYDGNGHLVEVKDFSNRRLLFEYDEYDDLVSVTQTAEALSSSEARVTRYSYLSGFSGEQELLNHCLENVAGPRTTLEEPDLHNVYETDSSDFEFCRVVGQEWWSGEAAIAFAYDPMEANGEDPNTATIRTTMTDARGYETIFELNAAGGVLEKVECGEVNPDRLTSYRVNGDGETTLIMYPEGDSIVYEYDADNADRRQQGNLLLMEHHPADGSESILTTYGYDECGNLTKETDAEGHAIYYEYDDLNQLVWEGDSQGYEAAYAYDEYGNLVEKTDANGNPTYFEYDAFGFAHVIWDSLGNTITYNHDPYGNLVTKTDENGYTIHYRYHDCDQVVEEWDDWEHRISYLYDAAGQLVEETDSTGATTTYAYSQAGQLIETTDAVGNSTTYYYDLNGNLAEERDANGNPTYFAYDEFDQQATVCNALGHETHCAYNRNGDTVEETAANGDTYWYAYDGYGRLVGVTDSCGHTTAYGYDTLGNVTEIVDANGHMTYQSYDARGRLVEAIQKVGDTSWSIDDDDAVTTYSYDMVGNLLSVQEPNENTTYYEYDEANRLIREMNGAGETVEYGYDGLGNVVAIYEPNYNVIVNTYNSRNQLVEVADREGLVVRYTYDSRGNIRTETDGNGNTNTYDYDVLDRVTAWTDAMGNTSTYEYDAVGNLAVITDRNGNCTQSDYDVLNRRVRVVDAMGFEIHYTYDSTGNLLGIGDAAGVWTEYEYEGNEVIAEVYADGTATYYERDCAGNLVCRTDKNGNTTDYQYNDLGFLVRRSYSDSSDDIFTYDKSGRVLTAGRDGWLVAFSYDGANRVVETTQYGQSICYEYDVYSNTRTVFYPGGEVVTEEMDARGRVVQISDERGTVALHQYDDGNRIERRIYGNGVVASYTYNANNWVTDLTHSLDSLLTGFSYDYDNGGNKLYEENWHNPDCSETYSYDANNRLVEFRVGELVNEVIPIPSDQIAWDLDALGNWTSVSTNGYAQTRAHNELNELTGINDSVFVYDDNGNLVDDGGSSYIYDDENRLTEVMRNENGQVAGEYYYDALGRRVLRVTYLPSYKETYFFYDGDRVIEEQDAAGYTEATYVYGTWIDDVLRMKREGDVLYYHHNALGSVVALSDDDGEIVERYRYWPYGCVMVANESGDYAVGSSAWGNPFLFTARRLDDETGLYYYRARYYDCWLGRFLQQDPLGIWGDPSNLGNGYILANNSPMNGVDPLGLRRLGDRCCAKYEDLWKALRFRSVEDCTLACMSKGLGWMSAAATAVSVVVTGMADAAGGQLLRNVTKRTLIAAGTATIVKTTAFVGIVGGAAYTATLIFKCRIACGLDECVKWGKWWYIGVWIEPWGPWGCFGGYWEEHWFCM